MPIIKYTEGDNIYAGYLSAFPDQYVSNKKRRSNDWIQQNLDFFTIQAYSQFQYAKENFIKNYNLVKGYLCKEDFYEEPEVVSFMEAMKINELPDHVKNYTIMNPVLNTLKGELSKRPDGTRIKAVDADSQNEELAFRTDLLKQMVFQKAEEELYKRLASQGIDAAQIPREEVTQMAQIKVNELVDSYTSSAEEWGNHVLEAMKMQFNLKELGEEAFMDLLTIAREAFHVYETTGNSLGFEPEVLNWKNLWRMTTPDQKYLKKAYALGTMHVMEMSEILEKFPQLTKQEIDHLMKDSEQFTPLGARASNFDTSEVGNNTIKYDTYNRLIEQERRFMTSYLDAEMEDPLGDILGITENAASFGNKFSVVRAYWITKIKVGKLQYFDEETQEILDTLVDEEYKDGDNPNQVGKVEWNYMNQWYYGFKIGPDVYYAEPFKLLPYAPIVGVEFERKNSPVTSLVDLLKPFQMIVNVALNQLWKVMEKEFGVLYSVQIRNLPTPKDGDAQDAIDHFTTIAKEEGLLLEDGSPENTKVAGYNPNTARQVDLSRSNEMLTRIQIAQTMKSEGWELVGMTRERVGSVAATSTATGVNASLTASYTQTEPYFTQHEYVMNQFYQMLVDAAQYVESQKPMSTLSYVTTEGEAAFLQINGPDLKLPDLKVFVTNRSKDQEAFQALKGLAQAALQNGASLHDVSELYTTDSMRKIKKVYRVLQEKQDQLIQQQQQLEQQQLQQQAEQFQVQMELQERKVQEDRINENYNKELDRLNKIEVALINASGKEGNTTTQDADGSGVPDILEISKFAAEQNIAAQNYNLGLQKVNESRLKLKQDRDNELSRLKIEQMKLKDKDKDRKSKEKIERLKLKNKVPGEK